MPDQEPLITFQASLGGRTVPDYEHGLGDLDLLRRGRVALPSRSVDEYIEFCIKNWSVDVVLESGDYVPQAKILTPQLNFREGIRRMLKFPVSLVDGQRETFHLGDEVVIAFLDGQPDRPVILGSMFSFLPTDGDNSTVEDLATRNFLPETKDQHRDRHEVIDYADEANPLQSYTDERNDAKTVRKDHLTTDAGTAIEDNKEFRVIDLDTEAKVLDHEHTVESGDQNERTIDTVRSQDLNARDLKSTHTTQERDGDTLLEHSVEFSDEQAKTLKFKHIVDLDGTKKNELFAKSDLANEVLVQHETENMLIMILSNPDQTQFSLVQMDKINGTSSSIVLEVNSQVTIRRQGSDGDAWIVLDSSGQIILRSEKGATVLLGDDRVTLQTLNSSVSISDAEGITAVSAFKSHVAITKDGVSLGGENVILNSDVIHLQSGVVRVGDQGLRLIPDSAALARKIKQIEANLRALWNKYKLHKHISAGGGKPTSPTVPSPGNAPGDVFRGTPADAKTFSVKNFRSD